MISENIDIHLKPISIYYDLVRSKLQKLIQISSDIILQVKYPNRDGCHFTDNELRKIMDIAMRKS